VDATSLLRSNPLFEGLSEEDLAELSGALQTRSFKAGQMIFARGDAGDAMYIVSSGNVNIHLPDDASGRISLQDLASGEFFGELSLFDAKPRSASALATTDAVLFELNHATLKDYLRHHPDAAMAILCTTSERLRETNNLLTTRASRNVDEEIDNTLSFGDHLADLVAEFNGSWKFIIVLFAIIGGWCLVNTHLVMKSPPDPYPYEFFNLALAILVGLQGPLIVMSQNRQSFKDRARAEMDFKVNLKNEINIEGLLRELGEFRAEVQQRRKR